jgi:hypothetical protein
LYKPALFLGCQASVQWNQNSLQTHQSVNTGDIGQSTSRQESYATPGSDTKLRELLCELFGLAIQFSESPGNRAATDSW